MAEPIRPSTVLPANRTTFTLQTADGQTLVGEVASPIANPTGAILCLHPLPTAGGMMDSHVYKKAANRDRKSTRLNSSHHQVSRMPSSA